MNTKIVTASGSTNGAIRMPMAVSIWSRIWMVIASQNNCTPLGTPVEVTLARRKKASAMTITAAIAVDDDRVGVDGHPEPGGVVVTPTSISASARIVSVIAGAPFSRPFRAPKRGAGSPVRSFFQTGSAVDATSSTWNSASPNSTPKPVGRKT